MPTQRKYFFITADDKYLDSSGTNWKKGSLDKRKMMCFFPLFSYFLHFWFAYYSLRFANTRMYIFMPSCCCTCRTRSDRNNCHTICSTSTKWMPFAVLFFLQQFHFDFVCFISKFTAQLQPKAKHRMRFIWFFFIFFISRHLLCKISSLNSVQHP